MKITVTTTKTEEIEIELPICVKVDQFKSYKVLSETEVIKVHVWECPATPDEIELLGENEIYYL